MVKSQQGSTFQICRNKVHRAQKQLTGCGAYILKEDEVWSIELLTRSGEKQVRGGGALSASYCTYAATYIRPSRVSSLPPPPKEGGGGIGDGEGGKTLKIASRRVTLNHCV